MLVYIEVILLQLIKIAKKVEDPFSERQKMLHIGTVTD